ASVGLEHTLSGQTVGSTRPGQPGVRYDPQARLLFINLNQTSASSDPAQLVCFGPRFWDAESKRWLMPNARGGTDSADELIQVQSDLSLGKRASFFGNDKENHIGRVTIHQ